MLEVESVPGDVCVVLHVVAAGTRVGPPIRIFHWKGSGRKRPGLKFQALS
jgi:hypothetical protein